MVYRIVYVSEIFLYTHLLLCCTHGLTTLNIKYQSELLLKVIWRGIIRSNKIQLDISQSMALLLRHSIRPYAYSGYSYIKYEVSIKGELELDMSLDEENVDWSPQTIRHVVKP